MNRKAKRRRVRNSQPGRRTKPVEINQKTVHWYARQIGLKVENSSQYDTAEKLLKKRLSGGYWKIIAQGQPLTEEAGDCQEEYCLVRGTDACTVCREKDMILKGGPSSKQSDRKESSLLRTPSKQSPSSQTAESMEEKGFLSMLLDWIRWLLGLH